MFVRLFRDFACHSVILWYCSGMETLPLIVVREVPIDALERVRAAAEREGITTTNAGIVRWALSQFAKSLPARPDGGRNDVDETDTEP